MATDRAQDFDPDAVTLRPPRREDARRLAQLYSISSDGTSDYVWSTLAEPGEDLLDVGERRYARDEADVSWCNCTVAELDGEVIGMCSSYLMRVGSDQHWAAVDPVLRPYAELEIDGSLYVCGVSLSEPYRGMGLGRRFMAHAEARARELGTAVLSLLVFEANPALRLYQRLGYQEVDRRAVVPHPLIRVAGDVILMRKDL